MKMNKLAMAVSACIYSSLTFQAALADDTEIYVPKELPADQQVRPNIMFILDSSGSMRSQVPNTGGKTRNAVMKTVVKNLIDELKTKEDVNVGVMRFRGNDGGYVLHPSTRLTAANADNLKGIVDGVPAGATPLWLKPIMSHTATSLVSRHSGATDSASPLLLAEPITSPL